ncbi:MAG: SRPBCC family protein [Erythrobacter sp.]
MAAAAPAAAEVVSTNAQGFVVRHEVVVAADPKQTWLALISPEGWWTSEHTWSGDAANLSLMPKAGGCFCERLPEVDQPGRFSLEGSAEHMRVVQAYPEQALRMRGGLGPLQSEPASGVLTITLTQADQGTRLVWEYNVGGPMRYDVKVIAQAIDGVIGLQARALADVLGPVDMPTLPARAPTRGPAPAKVKPAQAEEEAAPEPPRESVADSFGDLAGD